MPNNTHISSLCFCTAAFGEKYNRMAQLLATDLAQFAPNHPLIIYTNQPDQFASNPNVRAVKHSCRGVLPYHERRFAIWDAFTIAPKVMYLDADVRICAPIPPHLQFLPGLTARSCGNLHQHLQAQRQRNPQSAALRHKINVIIKMAHRIGVDPDHPNLKFINEFLFVLHQDQGREQQFLQLWGDLAIYADTLGLHKHPTYAMTLAAIKSNFPIHHSEMPGLDFFDDHIETVRIRQGQSSPTAKAAYFEQQKRIEQAPQSVLQRGWQRVTGKLLFIYNQLRVQWLARVAPEMLVDYDRPKKPPLFGERVRDPASFWGG